MHLVKKLFLLALYCLAVTFATSTYATQIILTKYLDTPAYDSELAAVKAMGESFLSESIYEDAEHMGAILKSPLGKFRVTHGKSLPGKDQFRFKVQRPVSYEVVAYWHTHGAPGKVREKFSATDKNTVRKTGLPFYLITPSGNVKILTAENNPFMRPLLATDAGSEISLARISSK